MRITLIPMLLCRAELETKAAEHEALEQAQAEVEGQLADAQNASAELTALKDELEASLASTKATLQSSEENLVAAQVGAHHMMQLASSDSQPILCSLSSLHACYTVTVSQFSFIWVDSHEKDVEPCTKQCAVMKARSDIKQVDGCHSSLDE